MERRAARWRTILELLVAQVWAAALVTAALLWYLPPRPEGARAEHAFRPRCLAAGETHGQWSLLFPLAKAADAYYLVRDVGAAPCSWPGPEAAAGQPLDAVVSSMAGRCHTAYRGFHTGSTPLCDDLAADGCGTYLVRRDSLLPCAAVLAGPFDDGGNPHASEPLFPMLTLLPDIRVDRYFLDLADWQERFFGPRTGSDLWTGFGFEGWVVASLSELPATGAEEAAVRVLNRLAAVVRPHPRPGPVMLDLGGFPCRDPAYLERLAAAAGARGVRAIGRTDAKGRRIHGLLTLDGRLAGVVLAYGVVREQSPCPGLPLLRPDEVPTAMAQDLAAIAWNREPVTVLLHWRSPELTAWDRERLEASLLQAGAQVVVGRGSAVPARVFGAGEGLAVGDLGTLYGRAEALLHPGAQTAGLALQCFPVSGRLGTCRLVPVAHSLGRPMLLPEPGPGCDLLPAAFFPQAFADRHCRQAAPWPRPKRLPARGNSP